MKEGQLSESNFKMKFYFTSGTLPIFDCITVVRE